MIPPAESGPDGKIRPLPEPIRYQDLLNSARPRTEKKNIKSYVVALLLGKLKGYIFQGDKLLETSRIKIDTFKTN